MKEQFDLAIADCKASIRIRPKYSYAYNNLGTAYNGLGDYKNALLAFSTAIELKPDFYWSRFNRAKTLIALGKTDDAIKDYEYLLNRDPTNQDLKNRLKNLRTGITDIPNAQPPTSSSTGIQTPPADQPPSSGSISIPMQMISGIYVSCSHKRRHYFEFCR